MSEEELERHGLLVKDNRVKSEEVSKRQRRKNNLIELDNNMMQIVFQAREHMVRVAHCILFEKTLKMDADEKNPEEKPK